MVTWRTNEVALILRMYPLMRQLGGTLSDCPSASGTTYMDATGNASHFFSNWTCFCFTVRGIIRGNVDMKLNVNDGQFLILCRCPWCWWSSMRKQVLFNVNLLKKSHLLLLQLDLQSPHYSSQHALLTTDILLIKHDAGESPCTADFSAHRPAALKLEQGGHVHHGLCGDGSRD